MDFEPTEEQQAIAEAARVFAEAELAPHAAEWDEEKIFPIATLKQAAKIGGVSLQTMIRRLRDVTGQGGPDLPVLQSRQDAPADASWLTDGRVVEEIDADAMLERGVHPIGKIREAVGALGPGEVVVLRSSFRPQPLIETLRRAGTAVHSSTQGATHFTWFGQQSK